MNYWELVLTDGETILVKPQFAHGIRAEMSSGREHLGSHEKIRVRDIKRFRETDKPYIEESTLLTSGEPVDNPGLFEPIITERGVKSIAVKKKIPLRKLDYYTKIGTTVLETADNHAVIGFYLPTHLVKDGVIACTKEEARRVK